MTKVVIVNEKVGGVQRLSGGEVDDTLWEDWSFAVNIAVLDIYGAAKMKFEAGINGWSIPGFPQRKRQELAQKMSALKLKCRYGAPNLYVPVVFLCSVGKEGAIIVPQLEVRE